MKTEDKKEEAKPAEATGAQAQAQLPAPSLEQRVAAIEERLRRATVIIGE